MCLLFNEFLGYLVEVKVYLLRFKVILWIINEY